MYYKKTEHKFIKFQKSKRKNKMYDAIIKRESDNKLFSIPFGDKRYENYHDKTGLNLYPSLIHGDKKRRENYRKRHKIHLRNCCYSPSYFSYYYLW